MRAAVYVRTATPYGFFSGYEIIRDELLEYCGQKGYFPALVMGIKGSGSFLEEIGRKKILQLAELGLIEVLVLPDLHTISDSIEETEFFLRRLFHYDVRVECMDTTPEEMELYSRYKRLVREKTGRIKSKSCACLLGILWKGQVWTC